jgi:predicted O-linked N-acetylglucosamine transferase (SPINDLY family)
LQGLKQTLANKRGNCPLFDTARYTRNLESAYITMWRRHQDGVSPASFSVTDRSAP